LALTAQQRAQQLNQAEELFRDASTLGFAKGLYFGYFNSDLIFPYPELTPEQKARSDEAVAKVRQFCAEKVDPAKMDREAYLGDDVIKGLGELGVLGMTIPQAYGGMGFTQSEYCRMLEVIGACDGGLAIFVNAHQSIGLRAILLEGTDEQKNTYLPALARGEQLSAFALTEPEAGSDAGNVQTTATLAPDGEHYLINGHKRYITNAAWADVMTLMARAEVPGKEKMEVTAFLLEPKKVDGIEWIHKNQPKCGVRGTWQGEFLLKNVKVPKKNVLGKLGRGLKLALSVLNFGRTTFGATCTGAGRVCLVAAARYANTRRQFDQTLGEFEMVKEKLAHMAADIFAMESTTYACASLVDRGHGDYMLETAILKVFASDALWRIVNDCIQIFGGAAYFSTLPYERMMRDARINLIGEGANDVMRVFIAMYGLRDVGNSFKSAVENPLSSTFVRFVGNRISARLKAPEIPVHSGALTEAAGLLARRIKDFGLAVEAMLRKYQMAILERQYVQKRLADAAIEIYTSSCVLSRLDLLLSKPISAPISRDINIGRFYLKAANRRIRQSLAALWDNDDDETNATADLVLSENRG
jgi:acyl-CoA dehydrogenase family protein 9